MTTRLTTTIDGFESSASRIVGEREDRLAQASRALEFGHGFLTDVLRVILPYDLILIGAPTGVGKTDLALQIATHNAMMNKRVAYFALEAEPRELERRAKFAMLCQFLHGDRHPDASKMNYADWMLGRFEDMCGPYNAKADRTFLSSLGALQTYYRGQHFDAATLQKSILKVHATVDLLVVDHLHYIDNDDDSEARGLADIVKTIRDIVLRIGKPMILVAHLRKRDMRAKQVVASIDDFHGSSEVTKIATRAISLDRAREVTAPKWWLSPTYITVLKDRPGGETGYTALAMYNRHTRSYEQSYSLGRLAKGGTEWEQFAPGSVPSWAEHHEHMDMDAATA